jgi:hypothetical protein
MSRTRSTEEQLVYNELLRIQNSTNIPIADVVDAISYDKKPSNNNEGGFAKYSKLIKESKEDAPYAPKASSDGSNNPNGLEANDAFRALTNAAAEAIVFGEQRNARSGTGFPTSAVFHQPAGGAKAIVNQLPKPFNEIGANVLESFGDFTPDILLISAPQKIGNVESYFEWKNLVDLDNYKSKILVPDKNASKDKIVVSPVEVTTSRSAEYIKKEIGRFANYKADLLKKNPNVRYVPVLVLDYDRYMGIKESQRKAIVKAIKGVGGLLVASPKLYESSKLLAKAAIDNFSPQVRQHNRLKPAGPFTNLNMILQAPKPFIKPNSLFDQLLAKTKGLGQKSKEWFGDAKKNFSFSSKPKEPVKTAPKGKLVSEIYQEMTNSLKNTTSYPQKAGIDIFNNSQHLDLMLAKQIATKDEIYEKVLKQSPNYRSKEPAEAKIWFDNMLRDGISLSKEYRLDSSGSQKIIRSYDNDASRPPEKSNFEKLAEIAQSYNPHYAKDREGLVKAVADSAIRAGLDPEQVLKESPEYLMSEKGDVLIAKAIEKAESSIQAQREGAEQRAQRDSQRGRGIEREP